ncbi:MAG: hypothetical protein U0K19_04720, partial [Bifidobacteriaceae bacterium]|nr:hypothetical protein [Bifidobacteriaceae bacterium]
LLSFTVASSHSSIIAVSLPHRLEPRGKKAEQCLKQHGQALARLCNRSRGKRGEFRCCHVPANNELNWQTDPAVFVFGSIVTVENESPHFQQHQGEYASDPFVFRPTRSDPW